MLQRPKLASAPKEPVQIDGQLFLLIKYEDRTFLTFLPETFSDLEQTATRILNSPNQCSAAKPLLLSYSMRIPEEFGEEILEIDPEIWGEIRQRVSTVWVKSLESPQEEEENDKVKTEDEKVENEKNDEKKEDESTGAVDPAGTITSSEDHQENP